MYLQQLSFIICKFLIRVRPSQTSDNNYYGVAAVAFKFEFSGNASYPVVDSVVAKIIIITKKKTLITKWGGSVRVVVCTVCRCEVNTTHRKIRLILGVPFFGRSDGRRTMFFGQTLTGSIYYIYIYIYYIIRNTRNGDTTHTHNPKCLDDATTSEQI
jgi:hypothetical protein